MKSGLWACAGASATASAAACAKRFDEPMTKESNVYFVLSAAGASRVVVDTPRSGAATGVSAAGAGGSLSATTRRTCRSPPIESFTAAAIRPRKCPSIHSRVKSFGTRMENVSPSSSTPSASANQVWKVVSLSAPRKRSQTSSHRRAAVSSIWVLLLVAAAARQPGRGTSITTSPQGDNAMLPQQAHRYNTAICRAFLAFHTGLHTCGQPLLWTHDRRRKRRRGAAPGTHEVLPTACG